MNKLEFVKVVKSHVRDSAISGTLKNLNNPPGKKPADSLVMMSNWYNQLSDDDKVIVSEVIKAAVDSSVFGFLTVLDGVKIIEDSIEKGELQLLYINGEQSIIINNDEEDYLHEMFKYVD